MRYGDPEYQKQINFISMIPSNKIDTDNLKNISDDAMEMYNEKHLRDLREQVRGYDEQELEVVADEIARIGWTYCYNAVGNYFSDLHKAVKTTKGVLDDA